MIVGKFSLTKTKSSRMSKLAWKEIDWTLVQKRLSRQQRRVYKASTEGKRHIVHAIQRRIIRSLDARLVSVRLATLENRGRNSADLDNDSGKVLSHKDKIKLVSRLSLGRNLNYTRKIYLPRTRKKKKILKPGSMLTFEDRAKQMLAKLALEPEWDAIFEFNSFGFRYWKSSHNAISSVFLSLKKKPQFVLEAAIHDGFNEINYDKLIVKMDTFSLMKKQIKSWLEGNILLDVENESNEVTKILEDTLQKGIISPLLVNILLHGLENYIKEWYSSYWYASSNYTNYKRKNDRKVIIGFSRYLNNFIVTAPTYTDMVEIEKVTKKWLIKETGLKLSKIKAKIINTTAGFKFLGFQIISIKIPRSTRYKVNIRPSKESISKLIQCVRRIIQENKSVSSYDLILLLSNKIIGWANYFNFGECRKDFSKIDHIILKQIRAWVLRRKSKGLRSREKLKEKYFPSTNTYIFEGIKYQNNWVLTGNTVNPMKGKLKQNFLPKMSWVSSTKSINNTRKVCPYYSNQL